MMKNLVILSCMLACSALLSSVAAAADPDSKRPRIERHNPEGLFDPEQRYSQVVQVRGGDLLFFSGQVSFDDKGTLVGSDLRAQLVQVFENLKQLLATQSLDFSDVIKFTIYIVNYQPDDRLIIENVQSQYVNPEHPPASTLLGVSSLARPGMLVEIDMVAAARQE